MSPAAKIAVLVLMLTLLLCAIVYFARNQIHTFATILAHHRAARKEASTTEAASNETTV
ncbi:hypothetical protein CORC01_06652 [Colletotrichum orchidophilum]|uniref:Uncharacterized protein n=1 Tax=Colletotrichum orchidophilum TaxID=1209926 RepID=A0A1G4B9D4_9PEZI|nr:uncharacterized protein CORC01_06652 [Colletotrichum orchidophilum]OHE97983.1 hypothetical protein CORC01_06652 [Colletotrichum orchidophilum]